MKHTADIIATAYAKRGLIPQTFTCSCCGDTLDRDDHMQDRFNKEHEKAVIAAHGSMVCFGCADDFEPETGCEYCGLTDCCCDDEYDAWRADQ